MANGTIAFDTLSTSGQISGTAKSVDTDYLAYGSAKVWALTNQITAHSIYGSLNVSSLTDGGTGLTTLTFSNNMNDANYSTTFGSGYTTLVDTGLYSVKFNAPNNNIATSSVAVAWLYGASGSNTKQLADVSHLATTIVGDIA